MTSRLGPVIEFCCQKKLATWMVALLLSTFSAFAQDPASAYLFSLNRNSLGYGGDLTVIAPQQFMIPLEDYHPHTTVQIHSSYNDLYRKGGLERRGSSFARSQQFSATHGQSGWVDWAAGINACTTLLHADLTPDEDDNPKVELDHQRSAGSFHLQARKGIVSTFGTLGWWDNGNPEPGFGLRVDPSEGMTVSAEWQRSAHALDVNGWYDGELADATINVATEKATLWVSVELEPGVRIENRFTRTLWIAGNKQGLTPTYMPWGDDRQWTGLLHISYPAFRVSLGVRTLDLDVMAYGKKGTLPFSKITRVELDMVSQFMQVKYPLKARGSFVFVEGERGHLRGDLRGHVEFWPWTTGWIDFLGLRRYFVGELDVEYWRAHVAWQQPVRDSFTVQSGLQLIDIEPNGDFEHWRPAWLVFGKEDVQFSTLNMEHVLLGQFNLGLQYSQSTWEIRYTFSQLFPVYISYRDDDSDEAGEPEKPGINGKGSREYGGGIHSLTLAVRMR
ncbi:MAG TPA: hypothetical protein ENH10_02155 [Bacteroidetes bacterium]|nr:hypothetical protein BMS3Bbin04_00306 [bacterium BMS3Bbin04]HDO64819.1 hypothetical protein [Bacteroidota bacterium]HEX03944.1 hypothetical protein [Bacteroidota bacterium]